MRNPFTVHIESWLGATLVAVVAVFVLFITFRAVKGYEKDLGQSNAQYLDLNQ